MTKGHKNTECGFGKYSILISVLFLVDIAFKFFNFIQYVLHSLGFLYSNFTKLSIPHGNFLKQNLTILLLLVKTVTLMFVALRVIQGDSDDMANNQSHGKYCLHKMSSSSITKAIILGHFLHELHWSLQQEYMWNVLITSTTEIFFHPILMEWSYNIFSLPFPHSSLC